MKQLVGPVLAVAAVIALGAAFCLCPLADQARAATWWVAPAEDGGSDATDAACRPQTAPCARIAQALAASEAGDEIRLAQGIYPEHLSIPDHALTIRGGYTPDFLTRVTDAALTVIDAGGAKPVLEHDPADGKGRFALELESLTLANGRDFRGGGLSMHADEPSSLTLTNVVVRDNTASNGGAGIFVGGPVELALTNVMLVDNAVDPALPGQNHAGGGLLLQVEDGERASVSLNHATVSGNSADQGGGLAIRCWREGASASLNVFNSIIWGNSGPKTNDDAKAEGQDLHVAITPPATFTGSIGGTDIHSIAVGEGGTLIMAPDNIDADPIFAHPNTGDYRLRRGSPAKDAGLCAFCITDLPGSTIPLSPADDVFGEARPRQCDYSCDLGADEWIAPLFTRSQALDILMLLTQ